MFGDDYDTPDGAAIRDYVDVAGLADAHVLARRRLLDRGRSLTPNLGAGRGETVLEIIKTAEAAVRRPVPFSIGPRGGGDPISLVADTSATERDLGWVPKRSDLGTKNADAFAWHERRASLTLPEPMEAPVMRP